MKYRLNNYIVIREPLLTQIENISNMKHFRSSFKKTMDQGLKKIGQFNVE